MTTEKKQLLDRTLQKMMDAGLGGENLDLLDEIVAKDVVGLGTAIDEKIFGVKELQDLLIRQKEQSAGMEMHWKINTLDVHISADENTAIYTNDLNLYITADAKTIEMYMRFSVVLEYEQDKWLVVHWHGSKPEHVESEKDTWGIETWKERAEELEMQVAARTAELVDKNKELAIEAALEKVRAVAMGMKIPDDMLDVCREITEQLTNFDIIGIRNVQTAIINENIGQYVCYQFFPTYDKVSIEDTQYHKSPVEYAMVQQMLASRDGHFIGSLTGEALADFRVHRKNENQFPDPLLDESSEVSYCFLSIGEGGLGLSLYQPMDDSVLSLFKRFHQVFSLAYQRFRDIQQAEAQAREAQIEAALERVRSRSLAMHKSEELEEVILVVSEQLQQLQFKFHSVSFGFDTEQLGLNFWLASPQLSKSILIKVPYIDSPSFNRPVQTRKNGGDFYTDILSREENLQFMQHIFDYSDLSQIPAERKSFLLSTPGFARSISLMKNTILTVGNYFPTPYSQEQNAILKRFGNVFEQAYVRFLDLQKAEAQVREAQIEAALERVRSRSMAMHKSEELPEVIQLVFEQLKLLNFNIDSAQFDVNFRESDDLNMWTAIPGQPYPTRQHIPYFDNAVVNSVKNAKEAGLTLSAHNFTFEEKNEFFNHFFKHTSVPQERREFILSLPGWARSVVYLDSIYLGIQNYSGIPYSEAEHTILGRFAKVFEQTYTRFLDLQKAEAQAREAEIQLALERVRARTMAMHSSDELSETAAVLFEQLQILGTTPERINLGIFKEESGTIEWWITTQEGHQISNNFFTKFDDHFVFSNMLSAWKAKEESNVIILSGDAVTDWVRYITQQLGMPVNPDLTKEKRFFSSAFFSQGLIATTTSEPLSTGAIHLLERFADVFDQTYTRFLDLQKAEAQARESQIEVALEKLRSASIAMHKSEELIQVVRVLDKAILGLGIETSGTQIITDFSNPEKGLNDWYAREGQDYLEKFHIPYIEHSVTKNLYDALAKGVDFYSDRYSKDEKIKYFKMLFEYSDFRTTPKERKDYIFNLPEWVRAVVLSKNSMLIFQRFDLKEYSKEEEEIFKRFGKVFEQAYTRFLDLQKAEAQALDAIKRASVDRVRAEIATMRTTSDLERIQPLIWNELKILGVPFIRCGVFIMDEAKQDVQVFLSTPDGRSIAAFHLPYQSTEQSMQIVAHWQQKKLFKDHMDEAAFAEYTKNLVQQGAVASDEKYVTENRPTDLYLHFLPFLQGMLYVGNIASLKDDELQLVQNLTDAFSTAYARYEDFNKLEAAKGAVESAMSELKATQSQLVQQEKLASLGQLTAGIAHEIRNPLNFVNNFSEVSLELIDESLEEMNREPEIRDETIVNENLAHIKSNIKKVLDHGTRANSIVNAMLMHSRQGTGKPEPTMLNDFIHEYSNLAYHGMRAGNHPLDVTIIFDLDENVKEVPLIAEDFSRVVLNICNNAFDAMREKTKYEVRSTKYEVGEGGTENFLPKLSIQTRLEGGNVLIQFEDNGPGIPDAIKDKILQPFFTTKKGTEGTGLGLSISHDIVKAHGGVLQVDTKEGKGTIFIIKLPAYIIQ